MLYDCAELFLLLFAANMKMIIHSGLCFHVFSGVLLQLLILNFDECVTKDTFYSFLGYLKNEGHENVWKMKITITSQPEGRPLLHPIHSMQYQ